MSNENYKTLSQVIQNNNWVILDTETTGLEEPEIVQIAIIDHTNTPLMNCLVRPTKDIEPGAEAIHGISNLDVFMEPTWFAIYPQVREILMGKDVIIYNKDFDIKALKHSSMRNNVPQTAWAIPPRFHCAMLAYQEYKGLTRYTKLTTACKNEGIPTDDLKAHDALGDVTLTYRLVLKIAEKPTLVF